MHLVEGDLFSYQNITYAVARDLRQHMFEERQPGIEFTDSGTVQIEGQLNLRFCGVSFNRCGARITHGFQSLSLRSKRARILR